MDFITCFSSSPGKIQCFTITDTPPKIGSKLTVTDCLTTTTTDSSHHDKSQLFEVVRGLTRGSHPETTVGKFIYWVILC